MPGQDIKMNDGATQTTTRVRNVLLSETPCQTAPPQAAPAQSKMDKDGLASLLNPNTSLIWTPVNGDSVDAYTRIHFGDSDHYDIHIKMGERKFKSYAYGPGGKQRKIVPRWYDRAGGALAQAVKSLGIDLNDVSAASDGRQEWAKRTGVDVARWIAEQTDPPPDFRAHQEVTSAMFNAGMSDSEIDAWCRKDSSYDPPPGAVVTRLAGLSYPWLVAWARSQGVNPPTARPTAPYNRWMEPEPVNAPPASVVWRECADGVEPTDVVQFTVFKMPCELAAWSGPHGWSARMAVMDGGKFILTADMLYQSANGWIREGQVGAAPLVRVAQTIAAEYLDSRYQTAAVASLNELRGANLPDPF